MINGRIKVDKSDARPLWQQIEEGVRRLIAAGVMAPGELVASVRELARELKVHPAMVAKAYQRLIDSGIFTVERWHMFVAPVARVERMRMLREEAKRFAALAAQLGASDAETLAELDAALKLAVRNRLVRQGNIRYGVAISRFGRRNLGGER